MSGIIVVVVSVFDPLVIAEDIIDDVGCVVSVAFAVMAVVTGYGVFVDTSVAVVVGYGVAVDVDVFVRYLDTSVADTFERSILLDIVVPCSAENNV